MFFMTSRASVYGPMQMYKIINSVSDKEIQITRMALHNPPI